MSISVDIADNLGACGWDVLGEQEFFLWGHNEVLGLKVDDTSFILFQSGEITISSIVIKVDY